jgi:hypothetical protein
MCAKFFPRGHQKISRGVIGPTRRPSLCDLSITGNSGIAVLTVATPETSSYFSISGPVNRDYCKRHGYAFIVSDRMSNRHPSWSKILLALRELERFEWLWLADADLVVTNPAIRLEDIISGNDADMLIAMIEGTINAGSTLLKNTPETRKFLHQVWDTGTVPPECWWENAAMIKVLEDQPELMRVINPEPRMMNSIPANWEVGDFVLHTPGVPANKRGRMLSDALSQFGRSPLFGSSLAGSNSGVASPISCL